MSADELNFPADPDALRALFADMQARIAASEQALEAERTAHEATRNAVKLTTLQIEKLKVQLSRLRRMKFGQSSERIAEMADQLELTLEDLEAEHAHAACALGEPTPAVDSPSTARKPKRLPLPDHLPRDETVHSAPDVEGCSACGGAMGKLGEDVTEVLEYVPGRFRVVRHVRPKLACGRCDAISQAPAPSLPIPRGRAGPNLLAHVVVSKFTDHLPLYRQSRIYAREGLDLSRSTLADWLGQVCWLLQPLVDRIANTPSSMPTIRRRRFWRRGPARRRRGDYGCICAIIGDGDRATDRRHCSATARIGRASGRASISGHSRDSCRLTPMPGLNGSMRPTVSQD